MAERMNRYTQTAQKYHGILFSIFFLFLAAGTSFGLTVDRVLATVNNEVITLSDYRKFVLRVDPYADRDNVREPYLRRLIEEHLILQEAKKSGIDASEDEIGQSIEYFKTQSGLSQTELEKTLAEEGMTMAEYRSQLKNHLISLKIIDKEVSAKVLVSSSDTNRYYEQNLHLFMENPEKAQVKALFMKLSDNPTLTEITDLKVRSLKISTEIKKGEPFEKVAVQHVDFGEFQRGTLIPALEEKIFSMKEGDVSGPVWTKDGVYILKVVKRIMPAYAPPAKVRDQIYAKVYEQQREQKLNEWMKRLWERSSVTIRQQ